MGREANRYAKKQLHVWILNNQVRDMELLKEGIGKSKTDVVEEALSMYFAMMRKQGVL